MYVNKPPSHTSFVLPHSQVFFFLWPKWIGRPMWREISVRSYLHQIPRRFWNFVESFSTHCWDLTEMKKTSVGFKGAANKQPGTSNQKHQIFVAFHLRIHPNKNTQQKTVPFSSFFLPQATGEAECLVLHIRKTLGNQEICRNQKSEPPSLLSYRWVRLMEL